MVISSHRITRVAALLAIALLAACTNKAELRAAKVSIYDADFAIVYSEVVAAVRELYPTLDDDPATGLVATAWHEVKYNNTGDDPRDQDPAGVGGAGTGGGATFASDRSSMMRRTFIRFDVTVRGGRPWKVRVRGKASERKPGDALPIELRGAAAPHWLAGRTDALQLAIYRRLKKFAIQVEPEVLEDEPVVVDLTVFGPIPEGAAKAAAAIVAAVETREPAALRAVLDDEVVWSLGATGDADTALAMWQADPEILTALVGVLQAGCREAGAGKVACPPAATESPGYLEWRATLELRGESWKLTSFVKGD